MSKGWIGIDFDGTLALEVDQRKDLYKLGEPIRKMVFLTKELAHAGEEIRIFTARANPESHGYKAAQNNIGNIIDWCDKHLGFGLPVTFEKDAMMKRLYDNRCVQVMTNTGCTVRERLMIILNSGEEISAQVHDLVSELKTYEK